MERDNLVVDLDTMLGSGAQGIIYKGRFREDINSDEWNEVAVKTPKRDGIINSVLLKQTHKQIPNKHNKLNNSC